MEKKEKKKENVFFFFTSMILWNNFHRNVNCTHRPCCWGQAEWSRVWIFFFL